MVKTSFSEKADVVKDVVDAVKPAFNWKTFLAASGVAVVVGLTSFFGGTEYEGAKRKAELKEQRIEYLGKIVVANEGISSLRDLIKKQIIKQGRVDQIQDSAYVATDSALGTKIDDTQSLLNSNIDSTRANAEGIKGLEATTSGHEGRLDSLGAKVAKNSAGIVKNASDIKTTYDVLERNINLKTGNVGMQMDRAKEMIESYLTELGDKYFHEGADTKIGRLIRTTSGNDHPFVFPRGSLNDYIKTNPSFESQLKDYVQNTVANGKSLDKEDLKCMTYGLFEYTLKKNKSGKKTLYEQTNKDWLRGVKADCCGK